MTNLITKKNLAVSVDVVSVSVAAETLGVNSLHSIKSSTDQSFAYNTYRKTISIGTDRHVITKEPRKGHFLSDIYQKKKLKQEN